MALEISIRESGDVTIVDLRGHSTVHDGESHLLSSRLQELIASGVRNVLLNLRDLTHIDSSGISILVQTYVSLKGQLRFYPKRREIIACDGAIANHTRIAVAKRLEKESVPP